MKNENLNELLDLAPIGLEEFGEIEGYVIYSSQKIVDEIKNLSFRNPNTIPINSTIVRGLDNKRILVGFVNSSLKLIWRDFKKWLAYIDIFGIFKSRKISSKDIITLGFFSTIDRKAAILLDPSVNIFGFKSRRIVPKITHELCHFSANENRVLFISAMMNKFLLPFYRSLFANVAPKSLEISDSTMVDTISQVVLLNEKDVSRQKMIMAKTFAIWHKMLIEVYDKKEATKIVTFLIMPYIAFIADQLQGKYINPAIESAKRYYLAYDEAFGLNVRNTTIPGQEFRLPSEIVAICNELKLDLKTAAMINKLPLEVLD